MGDDGSFLISGFYLFTSFSAEELESARRAVLRLASRHDLRGLFILAPEGCNWTCAGPPQGVRSFEREIAETIPALAPVTAKYSHASKNPFKRLAVQIRDEIVTMGWGMNSEEHDQSSYLEPVEWNRMLSDRSDIVVLDTRNRYETKVGKFRGAVDPGIDAFTDLNAWLDKEEIPKSTPVLMYCTGGIRCEKASIEMKRRGYAEVHQLHGGILKYLEEFPDGQFDGECFVFDHRVALTQKLEPSARYLLCPHCGDAGDEHVVCAKCGSPAIICAECAKVTDRVACSKNCSYHLHRVGSLRTPHSRR